MWDPLSTPDGRAAWAAAQGRESPSPHISRSLSASRPIPTEQLVWIRLDLLGLPLCSHAGWARAVSYILSMRARWQNRRRFAQSSPEGEIRDILLSCVRTSKPEKSG